MKFVGREEELKMLEKAFAGKGFSLTVVYGRRRVGKSELVRKALKDCGVKGVYFECMQAAKASNANVLSEIISECLDLPQQEFADAESALAYVFELSVKEKMALVLSEYQNLRAQVKGVDDILLTLAEKYKDTSKLSLVLVITGAADTVGALADKAGSLIHLKQMDFDSASQFYPAYSSEDRMRIYSVFGGMPYFNGMIDDSESVKENIIRIALAPEGGFADEINRYLGEGIAKTANANETLDALARGLTRYSDILTMSNVTSGPTLVDVLDRLIEMELVEKTIPEDDGSNRKKAEYHICDNMTLFYFKYIYRNYSRLMVMEPEAFYKKYIKKDLKKDKTNA